HSGSVAGVSVVQVHHSGDGTCSSCGLGRLGSVQSRFPFGGNWFSMMECSVFAQTPARGEFAECARSGVQAVDERPEILSDAFGLLLRFEILAVPASQSGLLLAARVQRT